MMTHNHAVYYTDVHKKNTQSRAWKLKESRFFCREHTFAAYRGTLESPIKRCFWSVGGNQEKTHAQFEKRTTIT